MNAITDTNQNEPGISMRALLVAVAVTAVLTGAAAWLMLRPATAGRRVATRWRSVSVSTADIGSSSTITRASAMSARPGMRKLKRVR